ncbi:MAG: hypothetical protein F4X64_02020 [Chloroflexi bacterium]|nr:hypothetical protein [Chloroflexota bacterium]
MTVAAVIAVIAGISLGVTLIVLLVRGIFHLDKLVNRVENQDAKIDDLGYRINDLGTRIDNLETKFDAKFDALNTTINGMRSEIQKTNEAIYETNKILVGLANHTHDADGRTVFTIPQ